MKKIYFKAALLISLSTFVVVNLYAGDQQKSSSGKEVGNLRKGSPVQSLSMLSFGQDVVVKPAAEQQHDVKIATAFNGWIFAGFTTNNGIDSGGFTIVKSTDHGQTWDTITQVSDTGSIYYSADLIVCGHVTDTLHLYFSTVLYTPSTGDHIFLVNKYDATTDTLIRTMIEDSAGTDTIYDGALATDYLNPSSATFPGRYSVEAMYSKAGLPLDSIIAFQTLTGGLGPVDRRVMDASPGFFGRIALSYGYSNDHPNGRYFVAYEENTIGTPEGHIKMSGTDGFITDVFTEPVYLDSLDVNWANQGINPSISVQNSNQSNSVAGLSAVVVWENNFGGSGDLDIAGAYTFDVADIVPQPWQPLWLDTSSATNAKQPDISYDESSNRFLATYWDETSNQLNYMTEGFNFLTPTAWTLVQSQYNDQVGILNGPRPQVVIDPTFAMADFAWIETRGSYPLALFDAENSITGIMDHQHNNGFSLYQNFPNPADDNTIIGFDLMKSMQVSLEVCDLVGNKLATLKDNSLDAGYHQFKMDLHQWPAGYYMYTLKAGSEQLSKKLIVLH